MPTRTDALPPPTLASALDDTWALLVRGADDRAHPFHLPVFATVDERDRPDARTVVLRSADRAHCAVTCHTDARSPKTAHLTRRPWATWLFYDPETRVQVRAAGPTFLTAVHDADAARTAWEDAPLSARRGYLAPYAPSTPCAEPSPNLPAEFRTSLPTEAQTQPGAEHFRQVTTTFATIDWVHLRHDGHCRARFEYDDHGAMRATWLQP